MRKSDMMNQPARIGANKNQQVIDFKRYQRLIWKKKYFILTVSAVFSVIWFVIYSIFLSEILYDSSAVIKFNEPGRGLGAVTDFAIMGSQSKLAVLRTSSFLGRVVDSLKYNIILDNEKINQGALFNKIKLHKNAIYGKYTVDFIKDTLRVIYVGSDDILSEELLINEYFDNEQNPYFDANGIKIEFNRNELLKFTEVEFSLIPAQLAIELLDKNVTTNLDMSQTILTVTATNKNPEYSAKIVNTVANLFVQQLLDHKRLQTSSVQVSLERQLTAALRELKEAEEEYQKFRERNPMVALSENRQSTVTNLASEQASLKTNEQTRSILQELIVLKPADKSFEEISSQYQRKIGFLNTQNVPGATIAVSEYTRLNSERQRLLSNNYSPQHPQVKNIEKQLTELGKDIDEALVEFSTKLEMTIRSLRNDINRKYQNLKNLPGSELQLAELDRNKLIMEGMVSNIMSKIEEAKVSDAAVIPDAYVIDEAEPSFLNRVPLSKRVLPFIGPFLGLIFGVGFIILIDLLDNSVKSVSDLESKTNLKVLATIPVIINEKSVPENIKPRGQLDPKLITSDFAPVLASEQFRFIRTKLSFEDNMNPKCIIITSIAPGDGKSLVSSNLAVTFAQQKVSTLLIDCDLRRGVLHKTFNCLKKPGISDLLISGKRIDENMTSEAIQETHVPHLYLISSGLQVPNPSELLGSIRMRDMLEAFKQSFQIILLDTPPIEFIPDALALNTFVHNILLVAREGKTSITVLKDKLNEFSKIGSDFKYVVLNASKEVDVHSYSSYSYYNY